jgi:hypothetical protein
MEKLITEIKNDFESEIASNDKRIVKLSKARGELLTLTTQTSLFDQTKKEKADWNKAVTLLTDTIAKFETELKEIRNNKIYENAFEWRFEFPEILNDEGDFVGFDVVIGNPPYGVKLSEDEKRYLKGKFIITSGEVEIYTYFIELSMSQILKNRGLFSFITTNTIYYLEKFEPIRTNLFLKNKIITLIELEKQVFADAPDIVPAIYIVEQVFDENNIINLYKSLRTKKVYDLDRFTDFNYNTVNQQNISLKKNPIFTLVTSLIKENLLDKLSNLEKLNTKYKVVYGIKTGDNKRFVNQDISEIANWKKCASSADNIKKYSINWKGDYLNVCQELAGLNKINYEQPKILIQYIRKISMPIRLICAFDEFGDYYPLNNFSFIVSEKGFQLKFLLALINSNLTNWFFSNFFVDYNIKPKYIEQLPLPVENWNEKAIIELVDRIINLKKLNQDTTALESEIDQLVYQLYGLTEEEIRIVEGK